MEAQVTFGRGLLLWLVGIPVPVLLILYFMRGCTWRWPHVPLLQIKGIV